MKKNISILAVFIFFLGCDSILDTKEKPIAIENQKTIVLKLIDETSTLRATFGSDVVNNAKVTLKSNTFQKEIKLESDSSGLVIIDSFLSDNYLISCSRELTPDEMYNATGQRKVNNRLINYHTTSIELRTDIVDTIEISLDKIIINSPLLVSEIYACGPPGAGLYFHDKYVEIYNQSDTTMYLDGLIIATAFSIGYSGVSWVHDSMHVHSKNIWYFPGTGKEHPINPGEFVVSAADAMNHTVNAENSIDLTNSRFEFFKSDAPDVDNSATNMIMFYQPYGVDWLIGGERGTIILARAELSSLIYYDERYLIPVESVIDGVEYLGDRARLDKKVLYPGIDAGAAGGIEFYTGKTNERISYIEDGKMFLHDNNNSSIDFRIYDKPSPGYHNEE